MKLIKTFASALAVGSLFFVASCNSGEDKKSDDAPKADTSATVKSEPNTKPFNLLVIKHQVKDFAQWLPGYEGHDTARVRFGLHNYVIGRGADDSNMVLVACIMDDANKAKEFAALPDLKAAMEKGGVIGKPDLQYLEVQYMDTTRTTVTARVRVTHKVKDYDAWKKEFDSHKQTRMDAGLQDRAIGCEVGNKNLVTVVFQINDMQKAKEFMNSKDLKDKMAAAGVEGPPTIWYYNMAKRY